MYGLVSVFRRWLGDPVVSPTGGTGLASQAGAMSDRRPTSTGQVNAGPPNGAPTPVFLVRPNPPTAYSSWGERSRSALAPFVLNPAAVLTRQAGGTRRLLAPRRIGAPTQSPTRQDALTPVIARPEAGPWDNKR